jgi:hypothetical protein
MAPTRTDQSEGPGQSGEAESADRVKFSGTGAAFVITGLPASLVVFPAVLVALSLGLPWSVLGTAAVLAAAAYPLARAWRIRLEIAREGVLIVNYFRRYDLPWAEVRSVMLGPGSMAASWADGIIVRMRRGDREILVQASVVSTSQRAAMLAAFRRFGEPCGVDVRNELVG